MVQNSGTANGYQKISVGFPWKILLFAGVVFGFTIFIFLGLRFGYSTYLDSREKALDTRINQLASVVSQEDQQQFVSFYSQLVNLREALKKHALGSPVLESLERYTLPSIYFVSAKISPLDQKVEVSGRANSIDSFVEQLAVLDASSDFSEPATVSQMGFDQGRVVFTVILHPRKELFGDLQ